MKGRIKTNLIILIALLVGGHSAIAATKRATQTASQVKIVEHSKFNLNHINFEQLVTIKGLGPSKAKAILAYRQKVGKFKTVAELRGIKGIGPKLYALLKPKFNL